MNGLTLAYIGDAYYELRIREYLINTGLSKVNVLHNTSVKYTSGTAQSYIIQKLMDDNLLSEDEIKLFKKGRNHSTSGRKNINAKDYSYATGFEALIGFTYLNNIERCIQLINISIDIINQKEED